MKILADFEEGQQQESFLVLLLFVLSLGIAAHLVAVKLRGNLCGGFCFGRAVVYL